MVTNVFTAARYKTLFVFPRNISTHFCLSRGNQYPVASANMQSMFVMQRRN